MKPDIDWDKVAKVEMRPDAPERPAEAVKTIARHAPLPNKPRPAKASRTRK
jgi:hypothetical protein